MQVKIARTNGIAAGHRAVGKAVAVIVGAAGYQHARPDEVAASLHGREVAVQHLRNREGYYIAK